MRSRRVRAFPHSTGGEHCRGCSENSSRRRRLCGTCSRSQTPPRSSSSSSVLGFSIKAPLKPFRRDFLPRIPIKKLNKNKTRLRVAHGVSNSFILSDHIPFTAVRYFSTLWLVSHALYSEEIQTNRELGGRTSADDRETHVPSNSVPMGENNKCATSETCPVKVVSQRVSWFSCLFRQS